MTKFEKQFGEDFLSQVPTSPAVYYFYNPDGELLYVGKAKNLRRRLSQYRDAKRIKRHKKMRFLVENCNRIEWENCDTDLEASLKEARQIQNLRPPKNIAGAYSFMYPMIGMRSETKRLYFCLTTMPENFKQYQFHGCYRSRRLAGDAYFALMKIFEYMGHPLSKKDLLSEGTSPYSYLFGFRQIEPHWQPLVSTFLKGESKELLEAIVLALLERPGARKESDKIQERLRLLKRFYRYEARPLATAIRTVQFPDYPVKQLDRDPLFLSSRLKDSIEVTE